MAAVGVAIAEPPTTGSVRAAADTPIERLVYLASCAGASSKDYQEMKAEVGLDHFEGRT